MDSELLRKYKELEYENSQLKRMYADLSLDHSMLKEVDRKKVVRLCQKRELAMELQEDELDATIFTNLKQVERGNRKVDGKTTMKNIRTQVCQT
jgi:hypothetical protein